MGDCNGTMANGPDKRHAVCVACGSIDHEANEGDRCRATAASAYEAKVEAKRDRFADRAAKARNEAATAYSGARRIMDGIPLGQPILVGHHSEGRHRRDIERIDRGMRKAADAEDKAAHYAHKAETYGTHGISSDDPAAVVKLRAELADLERSRDAEKAANAAIRRAAKAKARTLGRELLQVDHIELLAELVSSGTISDAIGRGLMSYAKAFPWIPQFGASTSASIRRVEKRIEELTAKAEMPDRLVRGTGYSVEWNKADNRVQIYFVDRPSGATIAALKSHGFRWARSISAWQRHASEGAWYQAMRIVGHKEDVRES